MLVSAHFLFNGCLVERIRAAVVEYGTVHPTIRTAVAPHLNVHPLLIETFLERLSDAEQGAAFMNCQFYASRTAIIDREEWQGVPKIAHHHEDDHNHPH